MMRKSKWSRLLGLAVALALVFGGCSEKEENSSQASGSQSESSSQTSSDSQEESSSSQTEPESSSNSDSEDAGALSSAPELAQEELPAEGSQGEASASQPAQPAQTNNQSKLVLNNGAIFGASQTETLGTQAELDAWLSAIGNRENVSYLWVSTLGDERNLSQEEVTTILDTLAGLSPQVLETLGNPATGGVNHIIAYGADGTALWKATVNDSWLMVRVGADDTPRIFGIEGQAVGEIFSIAG